jgi:hypothetical protein
MFNDELNRIEEKLLCLEFEQLKEQSGWTRMLVTAKATPAQSVPLEIRVSRVTGKCQIRTATGWEALPADRSKWPSAARKMEEQFEEINKQRRIGGRLVAMAGGTCELR